MIIFYHRADLDGMGSAALVNYFLKKVMDWDIQNPPEFIGVDYVDDVSVYLDKIKGEKVIMVDFTFEPKEAMKQLMDDCSSLLWIDHHKTSLEFLAEMEEIPGHVKAVLGDNSISAVEMVWKYFTPEPVPTFVDYLSKFDSWHHNDDKEILAFQLGMKLHANSYSDMLWETLIHDPSSMHHIVEDGLLIQRYVDSGNKFIVNEFAYPIEFEGYKFLALNSTLKSSLVFREHKDRDKYDAGLIYVKTKNGNWKVSLYRLKEELDMTPIAKKYGGGGHAGACGFTCNELPFK